MRKVLCTLVVALTWGCAQPQYTVLNDGTQTTQTTTTTQAAAWPKLSEWKQGEAGSKDIGVIIAIEDYAFLPDVPGAIENANDWESYLKTARGASKVYTLTNKQATSEEIKRFVAQAASEAGPESTVWFVFIGHGAPTADGKDGSLVAMDAQQTINSLQSRSVKRGEIVAALGQGQQKNSVVVLDTCFSGKDPAGNLLAEGTQPVIAIGSPAPAAAERVVVLTAAASNEVAGQLPGATRPAFSYLLLGAMRGWADTGDGTVAAGEAVDYVNKQFRHLKGRQQTPGIYGATDVVLASAASEKDPGVSELIKGEGTQQVVVTTPVNATGEKVIDTNEGLIFTQPKGWAVGMAGMGVILSLQSMHGGSQIWVERFETSASNAAAYFANSHDPQMQMEGTKLVQKPVEKTYGTIDGAESIYKEKDPTFGTADVFVFETYQAGAAYRFKLKVSEPASAAKHHEVFETFIGNAKFVFPKQQSSAPAPAPKDKGVEAAKLQFEVFKFFYKEARGSR